MGVVGQLVLTFILLCWSSLHLVYVSVRKKKMKEAGLPPGTLGLPFLGESLQLISAYKTQNPEPFIDNRRLRYGGVFTTHIFGEATVFSTEAEVNRLILQNEGRLFVSDYPTSISNLLGKHSLVLMKGLQHKRMHSLTMTRLASASFLKTKLFPDVDRLIIRNLSSWDHMNWNKQEQLMVVFLQDETKKMTFDLTVKQLMNLDPGQWTENIRKEYLLMIQGFFSVPISFFPFFTTYARAIKARRRVSEAIRVKVMERRKERSGRGEYINVDHSTAAGDDDDDDDHDMMELLLEEGLSDDEIVDFVLALLVAGYETTSTIMTLAVKFLTENPIALAQLKEEHEEIVRRKQKTMSSTDGSAAAAGQLGTGGSLQLEWIDYKSNMPFTQCVINETLRVANIISGVFRRAVCDVPIRGGYVIPKGWKVFASFRAVHLDDNNYKDARTFNPWRWQQQKKQGRVESSSSGGGGGGGGVLSTMFTPFGGGPRLCPGYELGRLQISVFLHHLVTNFSWTAAGEEKLIFFPTTRTLNRYPINITRISSNTNNKNNNI